MEIRVNLDVMMARRKISGGELAEKAGAFGISGAEAPPAAARTSGIELLLSTSETSCS